jgi:CRISPR-associated exonuclease Cas4
MDLRELKYKGTQVAYYIVCQRKLWLFTWGIALENESDYVQLGKLLDETSFQREERDDFTYEPVNIDFFRAEDGLVVHEVKHSKALEEAHILQVKYYIYYLKNKGIKVSHGIIHYPKAKRIQRVDFEQKDEELIEFALKNIDRVIHLPSPPAVINKPYCKKCAYWEYCYA